MSRPTTVDDYLAGLSDENRAALQALRQQIREAAPDAEEYITYGMPAFRQDGMLVGFAAAKNHCALYAWNKTSVADFADELAGFDTSTGTIRFTPDRPLPAAFVRRLVLSKIAANAERAQARKTKRGKPSPRPAGAAR